MITIADLQFQQEVFPKFDYSTNEFAQDQIQELFSKPLANLNAILERQHILKGFLSHTPILENYSYPVFYLLEVHSFLAKEEFEKIPKSKIKYAFLVPKDRKAFYSSKCTQLILLFHRLKTFYFDQLKLNHFPPSYSKQLKDLIEFLNSFHLSKFEQAIQNNKFSDADVLEIIQLILLANKEAKMISFWKEFFLFEAYLSIAIGIYKHKFSFPDFSEKNIHLKGFYHPALHEPVVNDFKSSCNLIILNGPNMSGKSTLLKSISLCIYLGHLGLAMPAQAGTFPFFKDFSININHRDDLLNGYSHFMNEIINLKAVLNQANAQDCCFAVFDELFSGTNVEDATAICKATIEGLSKFQHSVFFISTHIQDLNLLDIENVASFYIDCKLINDIPTFTYKLKKGWSDLKIGRILFQKEGLYELLNTPSTDDVA